MSFNKQASYSSFYYARAPKSIYNLMAPPVRDTTDGIINDFEICHYANPIYFRCLGQAPTEVLVSFSSSLIFQCHSYQILKHFLRIIILVNSDNLKINFQCLFYYANKLCGASYISHSSATQSIENKAVRTIED